MIRPMKQRLFSLYVALLTLLLSPALALAADDEDVPDGRLIGYAKDIKAEGSTALTWILLMFLAAVCLSAMLKSAKRSHLD